MSDDELTLQQGTTALDPIRGLEEHIFDYALALNDQMQTLIRTYESALSRWKFERAALLTRCEMHDRRDRYIAELESELVAAWNVLESKREPDGGGAAAARELQIVARTAAEREKRLVIELARAQQSEKIARAQLQDAMKQRDAERERANAEAKRAANAVAERDRLARSHRDASEQAGKIAAGVAQLEKEIELLMRDESRVK